MIGADKYINPTKPADRKPFIEQLEPYLKSPNNQSTDKQSTDKQTPLKETLNRIIDNINFYAEDHKFYLSNQLQLGGLIALEAAFVQCILSTHTKEEINEEEIGSLAKKHQKLYNTLFGSLTPFLAKVQQYHKPKNEVLSYTKIDIRDKAHQTFKMKLETMNRLNQRIKELPEAESPIFFKHTSQETIEIFLSNVDPFALAYLCEAYKGNFKIEHSDPGMAIKTAIFCIITGMIILGPGGVIGAGTYFIAGHCTTNAAAAAVGIGFLTFCCQAKFIASNTEIERQDQINKVSSAGDAVIDNMVNGAQIITEPRNVAKSVNFVGNVVPKIPKYTQKVYKGVEKFFRGKHKNKNIKEFLEIRLQKSRFFMNHSTPKDQEAVNKFMQENITITKQAKIKKKDCCKSSSACP
jgi:hypothetical protein